MVARVAIYYAPLPEDPLTPLSSSWLGRDPVTNAPVPQPSLDGISEITAEPRLYGFHATLKPPMRLAEGTDWRGFVAAVRTMAADIAPFALPPSGGGRSVRLPGAARNNPLPAAASTGRRLCGTS